MQNGLSSPKRFLPHKFLQALFVFAGFFPLAFVVYAPNPLSSFNVFKFGGVLLFCLFVFLFLERFLFHFYQRLHKQPKYFVLIYSVIFLMVLTARLLLFIPHSLVFLIPISLSAMILSLLATPNISLLVGTFISFLIGMVYMNDITLFFYFFMANAVGTFSTYKRYKRAELITCGYIIGLFNMVFILAIGLYQGHMDITWFIGNMFLGFIGGILSAMLSLGILPYFEGVFNIATTQSLLELSNLDHPLLKRLMLRTPGTYQHSMMVGNLAEAAAEAVKADPILARIGAYFHDIGKMKRPMFYTENQFSGDNPHTRLSPRMSKMVIAAHPRDGVELATKYKLPDIIKKFIIEHHGTSLVSFFYTQALHTEAFEDCESSKDEFRYPGPKPSFKESGIVMLADSVEAAVRSMDKPTLQKIEHVMDTIFQTKLQDGQLSECPLSMREIYTIQRTFYQLFKSIYHHRIDYQEEIDAIIEHTKSK